ncbi:hypothetical protein E2C01_099339 [Portunus trituberculatus]|uniref:Uncharacterized protein n=1 Tax=Portunus trituberculatus TaxID=210409 RepID=A0A5B7K3L1_PORTR|nr:hypothetical protein [Portunus trituberculatus]
MTLPPVLACQPGYLRPLQLLSPLHLVLSLQYLSWSCSYDSYHSYASSVIYYTSSSYKSFFSSVLLLWL